MHAGTELADTLPDSEYREYFGPDYKLHACTHNDLENLNSGQYLESVRNQVLQNLSRYAAVDVIASVLSHNAVELSL